MMQSIRAKLRLMLLLLGIIILFIFLNFSTNQTVVKQKQAGSEKIILTGYLHIPS
jgi:hypothetical protein